ncbi:SDR family oxidoreductase [Tichowtungia aerotolerans]|uniref:NAD(P)H-binding protein n=1 Tax=Tichowtungia aerotolerans TaxID=2697043 RepID=A0A6P1M6E8_9BACT|nr:SDR family oxidoreductase [Tichowtungia aerotolerans]QHI69592.1 NAD(P)H-binding protein [Tichowtungia aerotolerans]
MNVLIAGTGILGQNLIRLYLDRGDRVRALARLQEEFNGLDHLHLETITCDVTRPETLNGVCDGMDLVISCIGITRIKAKTSHMDVDFHGNVNLLREAEKAGVQKFGFISPEGVDRGCKEVPLLEAKYRFEETLRKSSASWLIFRAGGFFSDLLEMGKTAQYGSMFVIGSGQNYFTPVDVRDLAEVMVSEMNKQSNNIISVGGPDDMSWNKICQACFEFYGRKPRIISIPKWLCECVLSLLKPFSKSQYSMGKLMVFMSTADIPSEKRGHRHFADYLKESF